MRNKLHLRAAVLALALAAPAVAAAQAHDPKTDSPLSLLAAPKDPLAYYDGRARVRSLLAEKKAAEAEPLAEQIAREYPQDGDNWILLGEVKSALKKHPEAAAAYENAGKRLRWGGSTSSAANAAYAQLQAGDRRAALELLRRRITEEGRMERTNLYGDEDFAALRSDPEFLEITGRPDTTGWSRDYGWRRDVDYLRDEVRRVNAEYRNHPLPTEFERRYEALRAAVPQLSDEQILVGMSRMLAVLGQGHTNIANSGASRIPPKSLPLQTWVFPEGIFIAGAAAPHKNLVGSRLISIDGVPAEEALRRVNETQSVDGAMMYVGNGPTRLRSMAFLVGLGVAKSADAAQLVVQAPGGPRRTVAVTSTADNVGMDLPPGVSPPLFLKDPGQAHWHQAMPEHDALYVQLNAVADEKDETLTQYALRLRGLLGESAPSNLILDMRHNGGGSTHLYAEFLRTMVGYTLPPGRRLYVLTGRTTYSAAGNLATELEQLAGATFVGEATSECCTLYASPSNFTLPFSKLSGRLSSRRWSLSRNIDDFRRELHPHVPVAVTAKDYFAGRDPVMDTVFRLIERSAPARRAAASPAAQTPR